MQPFVGLVAVTGLVLGGLLGGGILGDGPSEQAPAPEPAATGAAPNAGEPENASPAARPKARKQSWQKQGSAATGTGGRAFCRVSGRLERSGRRIFGPLARQGNPPQTKVRQAQRRFAQENRGLLRQAERVAPRSIKKDVKTLAATARARGGLAKRAPRRQEATEAERRVTRFERRTC